MAEAIDAKAVADPAETAEKLRLRPELETQLEFLLPQKSHAFLLEATGNHGQFELAFALARSWLCQTPDAKGRACGHCASCLLIAAKTHPDLRVLAPESWMLENEWPLSEKAQAELDAKDRKPSKEIRIEALQNLVEYAQKTASREKGRLVILYPAEALNHVSANALLKTLEEPPEGLRFILASEASHLLLPTIRSRCQSHRMRFLAPMINPSDLASLAAMPKRLASKQMAVFDGKTPKQAVQICLQLCHDLYLQQIGAAPRFFQTQDLPKSPAPMMLARWNRLLLDMMKSIDHPYRQDLLIENLIIQSARILSSKS